jgi:hypothetical protein
MSFVCVLVRVEDAGWSLTKLYVNNRVRSRIAVNLNLSRGLEGDISDGTNLRTDPVALVPKWTLLFGPAIRLPVPLQASVGDIRISFHAKVVAIHVRDLLARDLRYIVTHGLKEHCICALTYVDLSKFGGACTDTAPLHSFEPCCHWFVSARTSRCQCGINYLKVNDRSFVEIRDSHTVEIFLVPATTRVKPRSKQVLQT